jgi:hypothetical protein
MKPIIPPIEVPNSHRSTVAKDQPEYQALPVIRLLRDTTGTVISCWELSPDEMEEVQKNGKIYLTILTFHQLLQPVLLLTESQAIEEYVTPK